jgi:hypothetical protein
MKKSFFCSCQIKGQKLANPIQVPYDTIVATLAQNTDRHVVQ